MRLVSAVYHWNAINVVIALTSDIILEHKCKIPNLESQAVDTYAQTLKRYQSSQTNILYVVADYIICFHLLESSILSRSPRGEGRLPLHSLRCCDE
jgi:hypothetical protein